MGVGKGGETINNIYIKTFTLKFRQTTKNKNKYRKRMVSKNTRDAKKKLELLVTQGKEAESGEYRLINELYDVKNM